MSRAGHHRRRRSHWPMRLLAALLLGGMLMAAGCAAEQPAGPPKQDEEALKREAEEQARRAEELRRQEEERRQADARRQLEELVSLVGAVGQPPSMEPPPREVPQGIPFDEAVPPLPAEPTVRVAVFSHATQPEKGQRVALILGTYERDRLEERLGMAVKIAYVAQRKEPLERESEIRYRPEFLRAAQSLARVLSAEQWIGPMTADEQRQQGVDVVVQLGERYR